MHILCFGDSITFGAGENGGWVGRLKEFFESKGEHNAVYNLGIPGDDSAGLLKRFSVECDARLGFEWSEDKYLIIIAIGTNDSKLEGTSNKMNPRIDHKNFDKNIKLLIKQAKKHKAGLAFIGLFPVGESLVKNYEDTSFDNERIELFNNIIRNNCEEEKILFLDMFKIASKEDYQKLLDDGLHPNAEGYDFMFRAIKNFLEKNHLL
jgi:lysophospholipase L1-like esterase